MQNTGPLYYDNEEERIKHQKELITIHEDENVENYIILNDEYFPAFDNLDEWHPV